MKPLAPLAMAAALAGTMVAIALMTLASPSRHAEPLLPALSQESRDPLQAELARCATLTAPDASCEAVWAAHRRRFLGKDVHLPDPQGQMPVVANFSDQSSANENQAAAEPRP